MATEENITHMVDCVPRCFRVERGPLTYLKHISDAEEQGYTMDEILLGLKLAPFTQLIEWLNITFPIVQESVEQTAAFDNNVRHLIEIAGPFLLFSITIPLFTVFTCFALIHLFRFCSSKIIIII